MINVKHCSEPFVSFTFYQMKNLLQGRIIQMYHDGISNIAISRARVVVKKCLDNASVTTLSFSGILLNLQCLSHKETKCWWTLVTPKGITSHSNKPENDFLFTNILTRGHRKDSSRERPSANKSIVCSTWCQAGEPITETFPDFQLPFAQWSVGKYLPVIIRYIVDSLQYSGIIHFSCSRIRGGGERRETVGKKKKTTTSG